MKIQIVNLYGIEGIVAYFRKQGDGCFDFVHNICYASELNFDEVNSIIKYKDWYLKQYNAEMMCLL